MAMFWFSGGLATLAMVALPHPAALRNAVFLTVGLTAVPVAAVTRLLRDRIPMVVYGWLLPVGTAYISWLTAAGGGGSASVALSFFYLWVVLYAVVFFRPAVAVSQIAFAILCYATVIEAARPFSDGTVSAVEPVSLLAVVGTTAAVVVQLARAGNLSELDPLTSAANRRGLTRALDEAARLSQRETAAGGDLVLAVIDVDHFKVLNDTRGHEAGDRVLQELVTLWRAHLRAGDTVARFGGDEFIVLMPSCRREEATGVLERLRLAATSVGVTCSVGCSERRPGEAASRLIRRADVALYDAKGAGRDTLVWA